MNDSILEKTRASFCSGPVRNVSAKLKVARSSRFCTGACHMFSTQEPFPSETPLTMKTRTSNFL